MVVYQYLMKLVMVMRISFFASQKIWWDTDLPPFENLCQESRTGIKKKFRDINTFAVTWQ